MADVEMKPLIGRLNRFCQSAMEGAAGLCMTRTNYQVTVEHVVSRMLDETSADVHLVLQHFGVEPSRVQAVLTKDLDGLKVGNGGRPVISPLLADWIQAAWVQSSLNFNLGQIRSGAMFYTLLKNSARFASGGYTDLLGNISLEEFSKKFEDIVGNSAEALTPRLGTETVAASRPGAPGRAGAAGGEALAKYCTDFTAKAAQGKVDPVFGREAEIRQMIDILGRRRKNNPICVGEPGVGKTAVVEGMALRIAENDVPDSLRGVVLMGLDLSLLQAGASVKGAFEERLKNVLDEVKASPKPIILFIDEAHTLIGAGGAAGTNDAGQLLKPALARGELRTIAATTWTEYKKYFEKDAALSRRFQLVKLDEPNDAVATTMLRGLRGAYEKSHGIVIRDEALKACAELGSRYIAGRFHPDKGIDLMDTSAARVKVALGTKPPVLSDTETAIATAEREIYTLERDRETGGKIDEEHLQELRDLVVKLNGERQSLHDRWQTEKKLADKVMALRERVIVINQKAGLAAKVAAEAKKETAEPDDQLEQKIQHTRVMKKQEDAATAPAGDAGETDASGLPANATDEQVKAAFEATQAELKAVQGDDPLMHTEVTAEVVARVVADWTGVPMGKMIRDQASQVLELEKNIKNRIKGQDHVASIIGEIVRSSKAGLKDPAQPNGVFLFVGPSGVGKTETALCVADELFGGEKFMTVINMSEFQEAHTVSRLIGSPPGYVGYGEGGQLTDAVRQKPYSVVLLDEIEKAHQKIMELFYQVFDKGKLTDGEGQEVDFKDTIIFMTSNLGTQEIVDACGGGDSDEDERPDHKALEEKIRPKLNEFLKPALVARMTVVPFYTISRKALRDITKLKLGKIEKRLMESHKMKMEVDPKVIDTIAARCTDVDTGARNVDHILRGSLLPAMSTEILTQMSGEKMPAKVTINVSEAGDFTYTFTG